MTVKVKIHCLRYNKYNRSTFFKKSIYSIFKSTCVLTHSYFIGLISLQTTFLTNLQIEMMMFTLKKLIKQKRLRVRQKTETEISAKIDSIINLKIRSKNLFNQTIVLDGLMHQNNYLKIFETGKLKIQLNRINRKNYKFQYFNLFVKNLFCEMEKKLILIKLHRLIKYKLRSKKIKYKCSEFNFISSTSRGEKIRMGRGKGEVARWHTFIRTGQVLIQVLGIVKPFKIVEALTQVQYRLPIRTKIYIINPKF